MENRQRDFSSEASASASASSQAKGRARAREPNGPGGHFGWTTSECARSNRHSATFPTKIPKGTGRARHVAGDHRARAHTRRSHQTKISQRRRHPTLCGGHSVSPSCQSAIKAEADFGSRPPHLFTKPRCYPKPLCNDMVRASIPSAAVVAVVLTVFAHSLAVVAGIALHLRQYQDPNSPLLVDLPACDYYRCIVTWKHGDTVSINWINAPTGTVNLVMMINDNNDVAYQIANVSSPSQPGFCDAGKGLGVVVAGKPCGRFSFIVPTEWTTGRNCESGASKATLRYAMLTFYRPSCAHSSSP